MQMLVLLKDKTCINCGCSGYLRQSLKSLKHLQLCTLTGVYYCFRKVSVTSNLRLNQKPGLTEKNLAKKKRKKIQEENKPQCSLDCAGLEVIAFLTQISLKKITL